MSLPRCSTSICCYAEAERASLCEGCACCMIFGEYAKVYAARAGFMKRRYSSCFHKIHVQYQSEIPCKNGRVLSETVYRCRVENIAISFIVLSVIIPIVAAAAKINHWNDAETLGNLSIYAWPLPGINVPGLLTLLVKNNLALRRQH